MALIFNMLSRFVVPFLSRSKHLLISCLQSLSTVISGSKKIKSVFVSIFSLLFAVKWSKVVQSCPTFCNPMDCSLPGFSIHGILQARILEWVTISQPKDKDWLNGYKNKTPIYVFYKRPTSNQGTHTNWKWRDGKSYLMQMDTKRKQE